MGTEEFIVLPTFGDHVNENESIEPSKHEICELDSQPSVLENRDEQANNESLGYAFDVQYVVGHGGPEPILNNVVDGDSDMEIEDLNNLPAFDNKMKSNSEDLHINESDAKYKNNNCISNTNVDEDLIDNQSTLQVGTHLTEIITVAEKFKCSSVEVPSENGTIIYQDKSPDRNHKKLGIKRARILSDEQQPSVHVMYHSLTRASKQKLEELLKQWSEWHARHGSSSQDDAVLESGEETFFPALNVGTEKPSAVSFWIDNLMGKQQDFISLDCNSVPLYDRGYKLGLNSADGLSNIEGGLEIVDASRCFNCGSYNHSLKECPKPRDNAAVNNARKEHKSKRNQKAGSRNSTRYYQISNGGKYDDLKPGVLDDETRGALGLGELDPPPWLNRMRELGYPPGYLDPDDEDQPSGITIFADEEIQLEQEDGEITETDNRELQRKMTVKFPGINGPIPEKADARLWLAGPSSSDLSRNRPYRRLNHYSETVGRRDHPDQRWSRDIRNDGPPGVDPIFSPPTSTYPSGYGGYFLNSHSPRDNMYMSSSPTASTLPRSYSERGYGSARLENWTGESKSEYDRHYSSHSRSRHNEHGNHRRR